MLNSLLPSSEIPLPTIPSRGEKKAKVEDLISKNYFGSMPTEKTLQSIFQESFVINKPMDHVGGDGFWVFKDEKYSILVAFDCMGHGRLATIITSQYLALLNKVIRMEGERSPSKILEKVHLEMKERYDQKEHLLGTGADMGIIVFDIQLKTAFYSGAKMDLYQVINGEVVRTRANRKSVGEYFDQKRSYEDMELDITRVSNCYLSSDGITDLFGGPNDKKFGYRNFTKLLDESWKMDLNAEKRHIIESLNRWNRDLPPTDDILLVAVRPPFK